MKLSLAFVVVVACAASLSCGDAPEQAGAVKLVSRAPRGVRPSPKASPASGPGAEGAMDIGGTVMNEDGELVIGRPLVVVDARGTRFSEMTDEGGGFWVMGATPPYDLALDPAPSGKSPAPVVLLGLTRADPHIVVSEPMIDMPVQTFRVGVRVPSASSVARRGWASLVSRSASGTGRANTTYEADGSGTLVFTVDHVFRVAEPSEDETVDVRLLFGSMDDHAFAYVHYATVPATIGTTRLDAHEPSWLEATEAIALSRPWGGPNASAFARIAWPDGPEFDLRSVAPGDPQLRLPLIAGATFRLCGQERSAVGDGHVEVRACSAVMPIAPAFLAPTLPVGTPPVPLAPRPGGALPTGAPGLSWERVEGQTTAVAVRGADGAPLFRAFTDGTSLAFARLEALGIIGPEVGPHELELGLASAPSVDALTEPDPDIRAARLRGPRVDARVRFPFSVTKPTLPIGAG